MSEQRPLEPFVPGPLGSLKPVLTEPVTPRLFGCSAKVRADVAVALRARFDTGAEIPGDLSALYRAHVAYCHGLGEKFYEAGPSRVSRDDGLGAAVVRVGPALHKPPALNPLQSRTELESVRWVFGFVATPCWLTVVTYNAAPTQREIAEYLPLDPSQVVVIIDDLGAARIRRENSPVLARRFESNLGGAATGDVVDDKAHEVVVAVGDLYFFDCVCRRLARPGGLPCRSVAVEPGARRGDPVVETLAGVGEVSVPAEGRGAVLVGVVGAKPVQVECGEFPDQFRVAVPERRND